MLDQETPSSYRRKSPRFPTSADISIRRAVSGQSLPGTLRDLTDTGCLIVLSTPAILKLSDVIELKLRSAPFNFRFLAFVRHISEDGCTAGLEFHNVGYQNSQDLARFIASLLDPCSCDSVDPF